MQRTSLVIVGLLSIVCIMAWYVPSASGQTTEGWVTLFDGTHLDHWQSIGDANWRLEDGVVIRKNYGNDVLPEANYVALGRCYSVRKYLRVDKL